VLQGWHGQIGAFLVKINLAEGFIRLGEVGFNAGRALEGGDRLRRGAARHLAVPALLVEPWVAGMQCLETLERRQRGGKALLIALTHRQHVQHVAVLGHLKQQCLRGALGGRKLRALEESPDAAYLSLNTRRRCGGGGSGFHGSKKGRASLPAPDSSAGGRRRPAAGSRPVTSSRLRTCS
jgi:hypothetical protein